ncbi:hypothetical protein ACFXPW_19975 [Streptomyces goshikiensis]|uniref:hypothetical protein n=1 Tax=Streptomyces goshikiensis TaxID=1942 RepID=UPI003695F5A4
MRTTLAGTFRSLSVRDFRLFAAGQVPSVGGTWMMVVAQDWLVLALTGDSAATLGAVTALQFTPVLLLSLGLVLALGMFGFNFQLTRSSWAATRATGGGCSPSIP